MNLKDTGKETLIYKMRELARSEREITLHVLRHLAEIERRNLFSELGFSSLFEYCVRDLGYSESSAQRRIASMRLLKILPVLEPKLATGALSLSTLSSAQSFFHVEKISSPSEKLEIIKSLEGKSSLEVKKELLARSLNPAHFLNEKVQPVSATHTKITVVLEDKTLKLIEELRHLLARSKPRLALRDVISYALQSTVERERPKLPKKVPFLKRPSRSKALIETRPSEKMDCENSHLPLPISAVGAKRYIPIEVQREVWHRDGACCGYVAPGSGRRCRSTFSLHFDHIKPFAKGGKTLASNLRLRCAIHNQQEAINSYGVDKIAQYVPRLR